MATGTVLNETGKRNIHDALNPELIGISEAAMRVQLVAKMLRVAELDREERETAAGILDEAWKAITARMEAIEALTTGK